MGTNRSKAAGSSRTAVRWMRVLLRPQNRGLVLTAVVLAVAIGGSIYAWQRWGEPTTRSAEYQVTPERIAITPQPEWIRSNVKADVLRSADVGQLDLRDRKLVERLANAFALHPWVAKVVRVEKRFPAQVGVELQYRRPVAVVKIDARGETGLLFIDERSVLLPSADFAPSQARDYLRVRWGNETPVGGFGAPWGSERIAGAARLAAVWGNRWQPLGLYWIVAVPMPSGQTEYELRTQQDARVIWGTAPGSESSREPSPEQKITALEQYVQNKGPLDRQGSPAVLDLRELAGEAAKTAGVPKVAPR